jgi:hypothetical protein
MIRSTRSVAPSLGKAKGAALFGSLAVLMIGGLTGCAADHPSMLLGRLPANDASTTKSAVAQPAPTTPDRSAELADRAAGSAAVSPADGSSLASSRQHPVYASDSTRVTKQEVIDWTARGVRDDVVLERITRCGNLTRLTAADENQLRDAGVSETIIQEMRAAAKR